jgi:hypothetical protein
VDTKGRRIKMDESDDDPQDDPIVVFFNLKTNGFDRPRLVHIGAIDSYGKQIFDENVAPGPGQAFHPNASRANGFNIIE